MIADGQEDDDDVDLRPHQISLFGNKQFDGIPSLKSFFNLDPQNMLRE